MGTFLWAISWRQRERDAGKSTCLHFHAGQSFHCGEAHLFPVGLGITSKYAILIYIGAFKGHNITNMDADANMFGSKA